MAKLCLKVWTVTRLAMPARAAASRQANCKEVVLRCRVLAPGGKQEFRGTGSAPVAAQYLEQARGEHGIAILLPFAMLDAEESSLRLDIGDPQSDGFADAQSGAVTDHQGGAVLEARDVIEEGEHFLLAEHDGEFVGAAGAGEVLVGPGHFQSGQIKKFQGGDALVDGIGGELAFVEQVELILADCLNVEVFGTGAEVPGETGDQRDIVLLGAGCEIAQLHIFDHALT